MRAELKMPMPASLLHKSEASGLTQAGMSHFILFIALCHGVAHTKKFNCVLCCKK
jgi:hypothetical protein